MRALKAVTVAVWASSSGSGQVHGPRSGVPLSLSLPIYLSACVSICPSISPCLYFSLSLYLSMYLSFCPCAHAETRHSSRRFRLEEPGTSLGRKFVTTSEVSWMPWLADRLVWLRKGSRDGASARKTTALYTVVFEVAPGCFAEAIECS